MGLCFPKKQEEPKNEAKNRVEEVDIVKVKLKQARDKINNFINAKNRDISHLDAQIKQKIPKYQQTGNKKELVPLLKAKKDLSTMIDNADVRLKLVNEKLGEVEMQQVNVQTINVLDDSNKYIAMVQRDLEQKDWRGILDDAKNKYELEWPDDSEEIQEDPAFEAMWNQIGGNKIPAKKSVQANIPKQEVHQQQSQQRGMQREVAYN